MAIQEFKYRGKTLEELKEMSIKEFAQLLPARSKRSLLRGNTDAQKRFLEKLDKKGQRVKTHCRDMVIIPQMLDKTILIYNGKTFVALIVVPEMLGHFLGEFSLTRSKVSHSAPGVGATRSSASVSVR
ncbi:30S ribosomal protein S19 [Candidatus Woesearchaeota archaeon]|mgnify:CR=1 FL=1|jgi:small subunit ribosomal protein S19|nr:30S ribosomal protein S19 [Candidatus Woesearchaeota archaeon]MBT5271927.1 30S ribosomal protein S19 [Candidatus Woesearchaeota archaeon]MBT6041039.1 30S ribosomal protein S19 [Candidatus Woesearchaeota archaeon]MBT6336215.1 30S ribosomal protein S19 [Candidatus Woesearchaeota archaeon]MBT7928018.1 30S ribosomal protein S19 [Candidatus Woesearchaeota archaeon]